LARRLNNQSTITKKTEAQRIIMSDGFQYFATE
jgi:hypothetical protein